MAKGKSTCKLLKDIRQQIADANGISYQPKECHHEGDCAGTCILVRRRYATLNVS